eukprot:1145365-Pelagomonas_calceolata.AAC.3
MASRDWHNVTCVPWRPGVPWHPMAFHSGHNGTLVFRGTPRAFHSGHNVAYVPWRPSVPLHPHGVLQLADGDLCARAQGSTEFTWSAHTHAHMQRKKQEAEAQREAEFQQMYSEVLAGEMRVGGRDEQLYSCTHCQAPQFMVLLVTSKVHMQKNHMCKKGVATPSRMMLSRECRNASFVRKGIFASDQARAPAPALLQDLLCRAILNQYITLRLIGCLDASSFPDQLLPILPLLAHAMFQNT